MEFDRWAKRSIVFETTPAKAGSTTLAVFDDTDGNLIQIFQV